MAVWESEQNGEHNRDQIPARVKHPFLIFKYLQKLYDAFFDVPDRYKVPLGEVLVSRDLITEEQLQQALLLQLKSGRRSGQTPHLGKVLVDHGFTSETEIIKAVNNQHIGGCFALTGHIDFTDKQLVQAQRKNQQHSCQQIAVYYLDHVGDGFRTHGIPGGWLQGW